VKTSLGFDPMLKVLRPEAKSDSKTVCNFILFTSLFPVSPMLPDGQESSLLELFQTI
jgi:hypothetical protein